MVLALAKVVGCADVRSIFVPFLDLYDLFEFSAASREGKQWTQSSPWYRELYWMAPSDYVSMKMDLPPRTFKSIRRLKLIWWTEADMHKPDIESALLDVFTQHMRNAQKSLPRLEHVEVQVALTGSYETDVYDPEVETCRVDALNDFLKAISRVTTVVLDFRHTVALEQAELVAVLKTCLLECSHTSLSLCLRSAAPSITKKLCGSHNADSWIYVVARYLRKAAQKSLQSFSFCLEVPIACRAEIHGASGTYLRVSTSVAEALDEREVRYICDGTGVLMDGDGKSLTEGPFFACRTRDDRLELWESEASARRRVRFPQENARGRLTFSAVPGSSAQLGHLSPTMSPASGLSELERVLSSLPNLDVSLQGSLSWSSVLRALPNVQTETTHRVLPVDVPKSPLPWTPMIFE
mmetsp:Transcript_33504/g.77236  ORF Transcript_33504/g.77236 Transcript_33504/m.77236 type:complete len:409 (-) Transcript_33504:17-1243(-)